MPSTHTFPSIFWWAGQSLQSVSWKSQDLKGAPSSCARAPRPMVNSSSLFAFRYFLAFYGFNVTALTNGIFVEGLSLKKQMLECCRLLLGQIIKTVSSLRMSTTAFQVFANPFPVWRSWLDITNKTSCYWLMFLWSCPAAVRPDHKVGKYVKVR